ncbi:MAG: 1-acyl-sn-glycerol-3-phosphate acyltransferase [Terriglobia bacterium]
MIGPVSNDPSFYGLFRAVFRLWFGLFFRRVRILGTKPVSGPALLVVNHPPSLAAALIVVAAFDRPVHYLLEREQLGGWLSRWCAHRLGFIGWDFQEDWTPTLEACCAVLNQGGIVLVFARQRAAEGQFGFAPEAAEIALEADTHMLRDRLLPVYPLHIFLPVPPSHLEELLIHLDDPLSTVDGAWVQESELDARLTAVDRELEGACNRNPFRLQPVAVERFITGLEGVMREDFEESWARRANWKQKAEDFELSPFLVKLANQLNKGHPGRLVALNEALEAYQEAKRQTALTSFRKETGETWFRSGWRRALVWVESVVGFPIAAYGLLNLLIAWWLVWMLGFFRKGLWQSTPGEWAARVLVTIGCYAGQIALAAHFLPRIEAGYYAPSLPISGAYLIRYLWLVKHRTKALHQAQGGGETRLRQMRKALIDELKQDQDRYAALWKIAH